MDGILVVSGTQKGKEYLTGLVEAEGGACVHTVDDGCAARILLAENGYRLMIVNTPLPDEFGHELAVWTAENTTAAPVLVVNTDMAETVWKRVEDWGILVLPKNMAKPLLRYALRMAAASWRRIHGLHSENARLRQKIDDLRMIDRAKCVLIQYLRISENQAHRYIEKQAMDMRITRRQVAEGILRTYES